MTALRLDHVAFGVLDSTSTSRSFEALGFAPGVPATCAWDDGSGPMAAFAVSVVLPNQYLDCVEIDHPAWTQHLKASRLYARGAAPSGIVLSGFSREELRGRGASYEIVRTLPLALEAETIHYEFRGEPDSGLPLGLIHDASPGALRRDDFTRHPNTATGVRCLHVRVPRIAAVADWLDPEALGIRLYETPTDAYLAEVCDALAVKGRPALLSIEFAVSDLGAARACLERSAVRFREASGRLQVVPAEGFGVGVQFVESEPE